MVVGNVLICEQGCCKSHGKSKNGLLAPLVSLCFLAFSLTNFAARHVNEAIITANNIIYLMKKEDTITLLGKNNQSITLKSAYHVSGMKKNLFPMANVVDVGYYVLVGPKNVKFLHNIKDLKVDVIHTNKKIKDLFVLLASTSYIDKMSSNDSTSIWHKKLGHINIDKLKAMVTKKFRL